MSEFTPANHDEVLALDASTTQDANRNKVEAAKKARQEAEDARYAEREAIALAAQEARASTENDYFGSGPSTEDEEITPPPVVKPAPVVNTSTEDEEDTDGSLKITRTINGKKVTKTANEWFEHAQKVEDADAYYTEAVRQRQTPPKKVTVDKAKAAELAKKIQLGTDEEAADATAELIALSAETANAQNEAQSVQERGRAVFTKFQQDFADIVSDPILNAAVTARDQALMDKTYHVDPIENFRIRIYKAGEEVRAWRDRNTATVQQSTQRDTTIQRKKKLEVISNVNGRGTHVTPNQPTLSDMSHEEANRVGVDEILAARKARIHGGI